MKLTAPLERVLRVLVADPSAQHYGYDLMKAARLPSGTLYPMLARLQQEGPGRLGVGGAAPGRRRLAAAQVLPADRGGRPGRPPRARPGPGPGRAPPVAARGGAACPRHARERVVSGTGPVQRIAERLIRSACRRLPADERAERLREWTAELPAILDDESIRPSWRRGLRALAFCAGVSRATRQLSRPGPGPGGPGTPAGDPAPRGPGRTTWPSAWPSGSAPTS